MGSCCSCCLITPPPSSKKLQSRAPTRLIKDLNPTHPLLWIKHNWIKFRAKSLDNLCSKTFNNDPGSTGTLITYPKNFFAPVNQVIYLLKWQSSGHEMLLDHVQLGQIQQRVKKAIDGGMARQLLTTHWNNFHTLILLFHLLLIDHSTRLSKIPPNCFAILSMYFAKISARTRAKWRWENREQSPKSWEFNPKSWELSIGRGNNHCW